MFDESKVTYSVYVSQDDTPVRGNAMDSGVDDLDRQVEDEIIERLNGGDDWAWALVHVVAKYDGIDDVQGDDYLGCCTYKDGDDFRENSGYFEDMMKVACDELRKKLDHIVSVVGEG